MKYIISVPTEIEEATQKIECGSLKSAIQLVEQTAKFNSRKYAYRIFDVVEDDGETTTIFTKIVKKKDGQ